jgi:hypothetical protein
VRVAEPQKAAEAHDSIGHATGDLVDHQVIDRADLLTGEVVGGGAFDVLARDQLVIGMRCRMAI